MHIDAHQHFWSYNAADYPWIGAGTPLQRDWLPADLEQMARPVGIAGCVAVQARQTVEESRWLLHLADQSSFIKGVVGWVDLRAESVENELAELSRHPRFVGVRHVVQAETSDFMLRPEFLRGLAKLKRFNLAYDLLLFPKHLPSAVKVAAQFPEQRFVLDHIAKPLVRAGMMQPWRDDLRELAKHPNVSCKVSGLITEGRLPGWKPEDFRPYLDVVCEAFGEDRLMFGSDWPVCLLGGSYGQVHALAVEYFRPFPVPVQDKVFGLNAAKFYRLA